MEGELPFNGYGISVLDAEKVLDVYFSDDATAT